MVVVVVFMNIAYSNICMASFEITGVINQPQAISRGLGWLHSSGNFDYRLFLATLQLRSHYSELVGQNDTYVLVQTRPTMSVNHICKVCL